MKSKRAQILKLLLSVMCMLAFVISAKEFVLAATANITISSSNVTQGDEFEIVISINADEQVAVANFYLEYDPEIIEIVSGHQGGGGGSVQILYYLSSVDAPKKVDIKLQCKAKKAGNTTLKYVALSEDEGVANLSSQYMSVTATEGSVTVKAPYVASTNNYLSDLKVEAVKSDGSTYPLDLSPAFSKDVTKYYAEAVEGVTKLVISATQEDSKASIKTSGTPMDPGDNTTTITVTAEDGSTRKYVIYTTVAKPPETTTAPPEPIIVQIDGTDSYIEDINDAVTLPEGFETFEYEYNGKTVVAAKGLVKNLIVMYVTKGDGSTGQLYIYEESTGTFYPMSNIQMTEKLYTIVKEPAELVIPEGYTETTVSIGEQSFKGWSNSEIENIYLIYAMNWNGESGLYYYDANEGQVIRYFDVAVQAGVAVDDYNSIISENEKLKSEINQLKADNTKEESGSVKLYKYLAMGTCIMAVIYLGIIIYLVVGRKGNADEDVVESDETTSAEAESEEAKTVETAENESEEAKTVEIAEAESEEAKTVEITETEEINSGDSELDNVDSEATEIEDNVPEDTILEEVIVAEGLVTELVTESESEISENNIETMEFDDEQDEIDDMLMDFEDIITGEIEAEIAEEELKGIPEAEEIVEFAEEIEPDLNLLEETVAEVTEFEEAEMEETEMEETEIEAAENEEAEMEETEIEATELEEAEMEETEIEAAELEEVEMKETEIDVAESEETEIEAAELEEVEIEEVEIEESEMETEDIQEEADSIEGETEVMEKAPQMTSDEKKKKVEEIMEDKDSSINAEDIDMVIDELFDDLFG